jgi:hypothetical protein
VGQETGRLRKKAKRDAAISITLEREGGSIGLHEVIIAVCDSYTQLLSKNNIKTFESLLGIN